jgi:hypothetical protein
MFDYVVTNPFDKIGLIDQDDRDASGANWMTVVDPTKKLRTIVGKIKRETQTHIPNLVDVADFTKLDMQGEFDNLHLAPGMIYDPLIGPKETFIKMAPFCVHDCFHTHFRWGNFLKTVTNLPRSNKGFVGRLPYGGTFPKNWKLPGGGDLPDDQKDSSATGDGKPLVPNDQTVKIGLTGSSTVRYFAKTAPGFGSGSVKAGTWTVFNHHGSAYALGIWSQALWQGAGLGVAGHISLLAEPYGALGSFNPVISTPAFYFRLRWTGYQWGDWVERIQILDLSTTTGVRS